MVSLMLRSTSPVYMILRNWFSVVAWCIIIIIMIKFSYP